MRKATRIRAALATVLVASLTLSACTTTGGESPRNGRTHRQVSQGRGDATLAAATDDFSRTVFEGALIGTLAGAAIGGIASGGKIEGVVQGAAIGAGAGLLGGLVVAENKRGYVRREEGLDRRIAEARQRVAIAGRIAARAETLVSIRRAELARLKSADASARSSYLADLEADRDNLRRAISAAESNASGLDGQTGALGSVREQLRERESRMRQADEALAGLAREAGR